LSLHFGGRKNLYKNSNVIFQHSEKSRTDNRFKARCYFRVRSKSAHAADGGAAGAAKLTPLRGADDSDSNSSDFNDESEGRSGGGSIGGGPGGGIPALNVTAAEEMLGLLPVTEMRRLLQCHDVDAKREILRVISDIIFELPPDEARLDRLEHRHEDGESAFDVHIKRIRNKGAAEASLSLAEPLEVLLDGCLNLACEFEDKPWDDEAKCEFKRVYDEIERRCGENDVDAEVFPDDELPGEEEPSEHLYGDWASEAGIDESTLKLYDDLDRCILNLQSLSVAEDKKDSVVIDAQYVVFLNDIDTFYLSIVPLFHFLSFTAKQVVGRIQEPDGSSSDPPRRP
jgi:hypothetical protein